MATPIVVRGHVGHDSPGDHDEVLHPEVRPQVASIDGLGDDWISHGQKRLLLGSEVGPIKILRSEQGRPERRVLFGAFQVGVHKRLKRLPWLVDRPSHLGQVGHTLKSLGDDGGQ